MYPPPHDVYPPPHMACLEAGGSHVLLWRQRPHQDTAKRPGLSTRKGKVFRARAVWGLGTCSLTRMCSLTRSHGGT